MHTHTLPCAESTITLTAVSTALEQIEFFILNRHQWNIVLFHSIFSFKYARFYLKPLRTTTLFAVIMKIQRHV